CRAVALSVVLEALGPAGMNSGDGAFDVGDQSVERGSKCFPAPDQYIIMSGLERGFASLGGLPQPALDAVAFDRIAGLLGDRETEARLVVCAGHSLQQESRTPGAPAPGGPKE